MSSRRRTFEAAALALFFLGVAILTVFGFAMRDWMPPAASRHAAGMDGMIEYLLYTTGAIFVIGHLVLIAFIWRFGRGRRADNPETKPRTERLWSIAPVVIMALVSEVGVLVIGLPVWDEIYGDFPEDALVVDVAAREFEWIIRYAGSDGEFGRTDPEQIDGASNPTGLDAGDPRAADDVVVRNVLRLPVNRPIYLRLRSHDVLHSFSVAAVPLKQDIVPGIVGSTQFVPTRVGTFEIGCAELCGLAHYRMRGRVIVMSEDEYDQWQLDQGGAE
jgi:cytochrome c oxidase subunit 2